MPKPQKPLWKEYLTSLAIAYTFSLGFVLFLPGTWPYSLVSGALSGFVFGTIFFLLGAYTPRLRMASFFLQCLARSCFTLGALLLGMSIVLPATFAIFAHKLPWSADNFRLFLSRIPGETVATWIAIGFGLSLLINSAYAIRKKIGPDVLLNWLTGKYYKPKEEERIFMFLDLKNSTPLGEKLGNLRFSRLVIDFFRDLTGPLQETKGSVSHYIGDEAVISWRPNAGLDRANCIRCFFAMRQAISERSEHYLREYGLVPEFKAGLHLGMVVGAEVGEVKSEIVFHGDVLNTTARIIGLCSEMDEDLLISGDLRDRLTLPDVWSSRSLGMRLLKGKEHAVEIVAIRLQGEPTAKQFLVDSQAPSPVESV